ATPARSTGPRSRPRPRPSSTRASRASTARPRSSTRRAPCSSSARTARGRAPSRRRHRRDSIDPRMRIRFWGVRASCPVPGPTPNRYGGNTSCVEVRPRTGPHIIIDAGTGIRRLGKEMMQTAFGEGRGSAHLLISHTHWDHIQGMPFFAPLYQSGNKLYVYARQRDDTHLRAVFASQTEDPYFPVAFNSVRADVAFRELVEGARFQLGPVQVSCARLNHPWLAMAYRLDCDGASVVYSTDTAPFTDILLENEFIRTPPRLGDPPSPEHAAQPDADPAA